MKESESTSDKQAIDQNKVDWDENILAEQILTELNGAVPRSTVHQVLQEIIPTFENARIQTFVPIFIRQEAVKRLQTMRPSLASPDKGMRTKELTSTTEDRAKSNLSSPKTTRDEADGPLDAGFVNLKPAG